MKWTYWLYYSGCGGIVKKIESADLDSGSHSFFFLEFESTTLPRILAMTRAESNVSLIKRRKDIFRIVEKSRTKAELM